MTSRDFCYWFQGYLEIFGAGRAETATLNGDQVAVIRRHLVMVFAHEIDPSFGDADEATLDHPPDPVVQCKYVDCKEPAMLGEWCNGHYLRALI